MRFLQNAVLAALKRVQLFLDDNAALLAAIVDLTAARKRLDAVVASFAGHAYDQDASDRGAKGETAKQRQLRAQLRSQQMEPIALIARKNLRTTPEFAALQMPKPTVIGEAFIVSGKAMADAATIHKDTFIEHGLPSTFLDDFMAAIAVDGQLSAPTRPWRGHDQRARRRSPMPRRTRACQSGRRTGTHAGRRGDHRTSRRTWAIQKL